MACSYHTNHFDPNCVCCRNDGPYRLSDSFREAANNLGKTKTSIGFDLGKSDSRDCTTFTSIASSTINAGDLVFTEENLETAEKMLRSANVGDRYYFTTPWYKWQYPTYQNLYPLTFTATASCSGEIKPRYTLMQKLSNTLKRVLNDNFKALYKAGYVDGDLNLTDRGWYALKEILFQAHEEALVAHANEYIAEQEAEKK